MNGVHDMGGDQAMGPVQYEANEPVFHAAWEGRIYALNRAIRAYRKWSLDTDRHALELLPPADYFRMSYYERWLVRLETQLVKFSFITEEELRTGRAAPGAPRAQPAMTLASADHWLSRGVPSSRDPKIAPRFTVGQQVRTRNINPVTHTRLPRYARDKVGTITRDHGVYLFPDTHAHLQGEHRQHVYSVRFTARELWGATASPRDSVSLDLWDDYLVRA
jgi:nitrile hydratase beta subunit